MVDFTNFDCNRLAHLDATRSALKENRVLVGGDDAEGDDIEFHPEREPNIPNVAASINGRSATITITDTQAAAEECGELNDMA